MRHMLAIDVLPLAKKLKNNVFTRQVRDALVWLLRLVEGERGGLHRVHTTPRAQVVTVVLRTDDSTTGMAGIFADDVARWSIGLTRSDTQIAAGFVQRLATQRS